MIAGVQLDHGWPDNLKESQLHKKICHAVIDQAEKALPRAKNFYLDCTWFGENQHIDVGQIDTLFLFGMIDPSLDARSHSLAWYADIKDPSWPDLKNLEDYNHLSSCITKEITEKFGIDVSQYHNPLTKLCAHSKNIVEVGYTERPDSIAIDYWAIHMLNLFTIPDVSRLRFNLNPANLFLCYQNKPHLHRQYLLYLLNQSSYRNRGVMTLSSSLSEVYHYDGLNSVSDPCMPDNKYAAASNWDNCTLGDLKRWQNSFLVIVSETVSNRISCFVSEKTYKPIIGLRPFVINGGPKIYQWLEKYGFDTFEDLWPGIDLRTYDGYENHCEKVMSIIQYVCDHTPDQIRSWYQTLLPRLLRNREHLYRHGLAQQHLAYQGIAQSINNLNLN